MASISMTVSFPSTTTILPNQSPVTSRRRLVTVNASKSGAEMEKSGKMSVVESNNGKRRELVFAAAAAAVFSVAKIAMADELKPGSPEAKKFYAPVCVTMPTAKICRR